MKKIFLLTFAVLCAVLLTGCGGSKKTSQVVCVMEESREQVTMKGTFVGEVNEEGRVTSLKMDVEGTIADEYYEQLKNKGTVDQVMNTIEQGLRQLPGTYFSSIEHEVTSKTKNNKIYLNIDLKLPEGYKDWGSKEEMIENYSKRAEWKCEEK